MQKLKILFLLVIILSLSNCKSKNNEFESYWSKLPVIKLPLKIVCGQCLELAYSFEGDSLLSDSLVKKYSFIGAEVRGRMEDDKNIYVLYGYPGDIFYPYLFTYNKQGKLLDSLYLHISTCTTDEHQDNSTWSIIQPDKSIEMTDTVKYYDIDTIKDARFLIMTCITKRKYKMDSGGIPKLYSEKRDSIISHTKAM